MNSTHPTKLASLALMLALAGCGAGTTASTSASELKANPPAEASTSKAKEAGKPTTKETSTEPKTNARGNIVAKVGQVGSLTATDTSKTLMTFKVMKIDPKFKCNAEYASPPENGHVLAVTLDVTVAKAKDAGVDPAQLHFGSMMWGIRAKVIKPNGETENGAKHMLFCVKDSQALPDDIGPGEHAKGIIAIDTSQTKGAVVLSPEVFGDGGWEYSF